MTRVAVIRKVSPSDLRAEGVVDLGGVTDTSVLFVRTKVSVHLFHAELMPPRKLDAWGISKVIERLEGGDELRTLSRDIGIEPGTLAEDLALHGWKSSSRRSRGQQNRRKVQV